MFFENVQMPSTKAVVSAAASAAATAMFFRSIGGDLFPRELRFYVLYKLKRLLSSFSNQLTLIIEEFNGFKTNRLFKAAELYLQPAESPDSKRFRVNMPKKEDKIAVSLERNQEIFDSFNGVQVKWKLVSKQVQPNYSFGWRRHGSAPKSENFHYELSFHKKHRDMIMGSYLQSVLEKSEEVKEERKTLRLFTLQYAPLRRRGDMWQSVSLNHPSTFDTLAMETDIKKTIMEDLELFVKRKEFYRQVGKAWKRGYLLFGPPGTGKSSLVAAMANYLHFDIYDLELTAVGRNSELRKILMSTANRSILVVEDIDCSIKTKDEFKGNITMDPFSHHPQQVSQVTLSGLLNFIDGLWSSFGDERIIVFTTNHKDRLDPALLRPGRMDMHIHMSYCTPGGFRVLASNYLGLAQHPLFMEIEKLMEATKVTPAEVGEELLKSEEPEAALRCLIEFLERKKAECNNNKAGKEEWEVVGEGNREAPEGKQS